MSKEQTFRSEDNAFLPLRRRQLSVRCVTTQSKWKGEPSIKKDFETEQSGVFSAPGSPLAHFSTAESGFNSGWRASRAITGEAYSSAAIS
jgi:hypothetical protein